MLENAPVLSNLELAYICYLFYGISDVANVTKMFLLVAELSLTSRLGTKGSSKYTSK